MPNRMWEGPNCSLSTAMTPSVRDRPPARTRAAVLARKPSASTARSTRRRVPTATPGNPLSTRDTVMTETPARAATSAITGRGGGPPSGLLVVEPVECRIPVNGEHPDGAAEEATRHLGGQVAAVHLGQRVLPRVVLVPEGHRVG